MAGGGRAGNGKARQSPQRVSNRLSGERKFRIFEELVEEDDECAHDGGQRLALCRDGVRRRRRGGFGRAEARRRGEDQRLTLLRTFCGERLWLQKFVTLVFFAAWAPGLCCGRRVRWGGSGQAGEAAVRHRAAELLREGSLVEDRLDEAKHLPDGVQVAFDVCRGVRAGRVEDTHL